MIRAVGLILGLLLGISLAMGSVAHATEGFAPTQALHEMLDDGSSSGPISSDDDKSLPHAHACHCHHIGVPQTPFDHGLGRVVMRLLAPSPTRPLPTLRPQAPSRPPQA